MIAAAAQQVSWPEAVIWAAVALAGGMVGFAYFWRH